MCEVTKLSISSNTHLFKIYWKLLIFFPLKNPPFWGGFFKEENRTNNTIAPKSWHYESIQNIWSNGFYFVCLKLTHFGVIRILIHSSFKNPQKCFIHFDKIYVYYYPHKYLALTICDCLKVLSVYSIQMMRSPIWTVEGSLVLNNSFWTKQR